MSDINDDKRIAPSYSPGQAPKAAPCQAGCLNCADIRGWIALVAQRRKLGLTRHEAIARAWELIAEVNPFPATLGRICPHPCEQACNRGAQDEPLAINAMERFLGDYAIESGLPLPRTNGKAGNGTLAVVGAGPSGLSFAYQMARRGHAVTVYDARERAGGMLRYGVPEYRLPRDVLDAEIARISDLGVELRLAARVGKDVDIDGLRRRYDAVYIGVGAQNGRGLNIPGADGPGVFTATGYLSGLSQGQDVPLGKQVVVVGGGNSAMDAARSARRNGSEVTIVYRRSLEEMPASQSEIEEAAEEGVELRLLATPTSFIRNAAGELKAVEVVRVGLGAPDESGRPRPVTRKGTEYRLPADSVILAISQVPVLDGLGDLADNGSWITVDGCGEVSDGVYAGGDAVALGMAGSAIIQGRQAAEGLHARLTNLGGEEEPDVLRTTFAGEINNVAPARREAARTPRRDVADRLAHPATEVSKTIDEETFLAEAERCFSCGSCFGCEQCNMYCTAGCYTRADSPSPGAYFVFDDTACLKCGKCIEVCPCGFLEVV